MGNLKTMQHQAFPGQLRKLWLSVALMLTTSSIARADLAETMAEFVQWRSESAGTAIKDVHELEVWATRLNNEIQNAGEDSSYHVAVSMLAEVYTGLGEYEQAYLGYREVAEAPSQPIEGKLWALSMAVYVSLAAEHDIDFVLEQFTEYEQLVDMTLTQGGYLPEDIVRQAQQLDLKRSQFVEAYARRQAEFMREAGMPQIGIDETLGSLLERASVYLVDYYERSIEQGEAWFLQETDYAIYQAAKLLSESAELQSRSEAEAHVIHEQARSLLKSFFESGIETDIPVQLNSSMLREAFFARESNAQFVDEAYALFATFTPNHETLTFLRSQALKFSNDDGKLVLANDLFRLVNQYSKEWYPDEYSSHVNYQWSLLGRGRNALKLGNFLEASFIIKELEGLELQGDAFEGIFDDLQSAYIKYVKNEFIKLDDKGNALEPQTFNSFEPIAQPTEDYVAAKRSEQMGRAVRSDRPESINTMNAPLYESGDSSKSSTHDRWLTPRTTIALIITSIIAGMIVIVIWRR